MGAVEWSGARTRFAWTIHYTALLSAVLLALLNLLFNGPQRLFGRLAGEADESAVSVRCGIQVIPHEPALQVEDRCGIGDAEKRFGGARL